MCESCWERANGGRLDSSAPSPASVLSGPFPQTGTGNGGAGVRNIRRSDKRAVEKATTDGEDWAAAAVEAEEVGDKSTSSTKGTAGSRQKKVEGKQ